MELKPETFTWQALYKLLTGAILPRPIGWISSLDPTGLPNLAPFSFFTVVCPNPPTLLFCPTVRGTDLAEKDTLRNVRSSGEFVVNIVTEALAEQMNLTSTEFPAGIDEFEAAGLTPEQSVAVRPPRVGESPMHFECRVDQIVDYGSQAGGGSIVVGRIVHIHVMDGILLPPDKINLAALQPVGRLAGGEYCRVTDLFHLPRPPSQIVSKPAQ